MSKQPNPGFYYTAKLVAPLPGPSSDEMEVQRKVQALRKIYKASCGRKMIVPEIDTVYEDRHGDLLLIYKFDFAKGSCSYFRSCRPSGWKEGEPWIITDHTTLIIGIIAVQFKLKNGNW